MIEIRPLTDLSLDDLLRVASGYVSNHKYEVIHSETDDLISFTLRLIPLEIPYVKKYEFNDETIDIYRPFLKSGFSFGAYDGDRLVGLAVSEVHAWNNTLWVHDFYVAETHRGRGIGKRLMERVASIASDAGLRAIVCETQNKNAVGIKIYKKLGFRLQGIDLIHYRNSDYPEGEIAVFMKRRLA